MKKLITLFAALFLFGCGSGGGGHKHHDPKPEPTEWISLGKAHIKASMKDGFSLQQTENITYTSVSVNQITLNTANLASSPTEDANSVLDLGSFSLSNLKINDLNQCGTGTQKCTTVRIALYTADLGGANAGLGGFVNTSYNYGGQDVTISATTGGASETVLLGSGNAVGIETVDSTSLNRVTQANFVNGPYLLEADFSNAGEGLYEMNLVIDIQAAL